MFVVACHCYECQKQTGSAFGVYANIEADRVKTTSSDPPQEITIARIGQSTSPVRGYACPKCWSILWETSSNPGVISIKVGSLDMPSIMAPDLHTFIDTKVPWLSLPEDAKTCKGPSGGTEIWPKSSLKRLEACRVKWEAAQEQAADKIKDQHAEEPTQEEPDSQADKTPTAETAEEVDDEDQDQELDEEFERRQKVLEERLAKLTLKISEQEK